MGVNRSVRVRLAGVVALILACQLLTAQSPAVAVTTQSRIIQGSASDTQQKEWFNKPFDTRDRFFGKLQGRIRFVTDTRATLSTTRTVGSTDQGTIDAGEGRTTTITNVANAARLALTARPALQLIFEWQPDGESYVCDNTTFPVLSGDDWFMRRDDGGPVADGVCGAIEVTADDLSWIHQQFGIDLELPEVFILLDRFFSAGFGGTQALSASHRLLDIKVCKIVTDTFGVPIGDHCAIELNADVSAPLTTLGHTLEAQLCTNGQVNGQEIDCLVPLEGRRPVTFTDTSSTYSAKAPCPSAPTDLDVRITNPAWNTILEDVSISATADLNVHLTAAGDGVDVITLPLPGSISLLNTVMPLNVTYTNHDDFVLHVGEVTPDDDAPTVVLNPNAVTIDEGSTAAFAPSLVDLCSATADLTAAWSIDGLSLSGPTLTRTYDNDLPNPVHSGTLLVTDQAGNQSAAQPFGVTVRNVAPSLQLSGLPTGPIARGTAVNLVCQVGDPGADIETWTWAFGDGTSESRAATSVSDRSDSRSHRYAAEGIYTLQVGVHDGTDSRSVSGAVTVFDPIDRLVGSGSFRADTTSINVPVGSNYSAQATVSYSNGAIHPSGSFVSDFLISTGGGQTAPGRLVATSYDWIFEAGLLSRTQGFATLNAQPGWKFHAEMARSKLGAQTARITVSIWRPGVTTLVNPDYRFSGPRRTGNLQ